MGRRRSEGFRPAGSIPVDDLGLPRTKRQELLVASAWRRAAGPGVCARVGARMGRGDTLILSVADERWEGVLEELLPRLAARLAAEAPELRVRRFKIEGVPGASVKPRELPVLEAEPDSPEAARPIESSRSSAAVDALPIERRLERLAASYLSRQKP